MVKVRIEVSYLDGVEDPEALTIFKNLSSLGYDSVKSLRIIRSYELDIDSPHYESVARDIGQNLMINPVIHRMKIVKVEDVE